MTDPIVQVTDLTRTYGRGAQAVHALAGVNLTVGRGSLVALMGRSGSGKTTLLNCIGGLDRPTNRPGSWTAPPGNKSLRCFDSWWTNRGSR